MSNWIYILPRSLWLLEFFKKLQILFAVIFDTTLFVNIKDCYLGSFLTLVFCINSWWFNLIKVNVLSRKTRNCDFTCSSLYHILQYFGVELLSMVENRLLVFINHFSLDIWYSSNDCHVVWFCSGYTELMCDFLYHTFGSI